MGQCESHEYNTESLPLGVALDEARRRRAALGLSPKTGLALLAPDFRTMRRSLEYTTSRDRDVPHRSLQCVF